MAMATMAEIESAAKRFSEARAALAQCCGELQGELNAVRTKRLEALKAKVAEARARHAEAAALVAGSPELFKRPRSVVFHGVKLGFEKSKGKLSIADAKRTVGLIKKFFSDKASVLIKTDEKPVKKALAQLKAEELKKLAVEVTADGDVVFVQDTAAEVDKLVEAFLQDGSKRNDEPDEE
jgi:hypothetical protein